MNAELPTTSDAQARRTNAYRARIHVRLRQRLETEALPGAPIGRNSPRSARTIYAEQLSGSPFTAPRATNERTWLHRIRPTVAHIGPFEQVDIGLWRTAPCHEVDVPIAPMRWSPSRADGARSFVEASGRSRRRATQARRPAWAHTLSQRARWARVAHDADGELLFVPQSGGRGSARSSA